MVDLSQDLPPEDLPADEFDVGGAVLRVAIAPLFARRRRYFAASLRACSSSRICPLNSSTFTMPPDVPRRPRGRGSRRTGPQAYCNSPGPRGRRSFRRRRTARRASTSMGSEAVPRRDGSPGWSCFDHVPAELANLLERLSCFVGQHVPPQKVVVFTVGSRPGSCSGGIRSGRPGRRSHNSDARTS